MKKHLPSAVILSALLLVLCLHAFAAENESFDSGTRTSASSGAGYLFTNLQEPAYTDYTDVIPTVTAARTNGNLRTEPDITVNGISIGHMTARTTVDGAAYVAVVPVLQTLYPDIVVDLREGRLTAAATGITLHAAAGDAYFQVNERYIYTPGTVACSCRSRRCAKPWAALSWAAKRARIWSSAKWSPPSPPILMWKTISTGSPAPSMPRPATNP